MNVSLRTLIISVAAAALLLVFVANALVMVGIVKSVVDPITFDQARAVTHSTAQMISLHVSRFSAPIERLQAQCLVVDDLCTASSIVSGSAGTMPTHNNISSFVAMSVRNALFELNYSMPFFTAVGLAISAAPTPTQAAASPSASANDVNSRRGIVTWGGRSPFVKDTAIVETVSSSFDDNNIDDVLSTRWSIASSTDDAAPQQQQQQQQQHREDSLRIAGASPSAAAVLFSRHAADGSMFVVANSSSASIYDFWAQLFSADKMTNMNWRRRDGERNGDESLQPCALNFSYTPTAAYRAALAAGRHSGASSGRASFFATFTCFLSNRTHSNIGYAATSVVAPDLRSMLTDALDALGPSAAESRAAAASSYGFSSSSSTDWAHAFILDPDGNVVASAGDSDTQPSFPEGELRSEGVSAGNNNQVVVMGAMRRSSWDDAKAWASAKTLLGGLDRSSFLLASEERFATLPSPASAHSSSLLSLSAGGGLIAVSRPVGNGHHLIVVVDPSQMQQLGSLDPAVMALLASLAVSGGIGLLVALMVRSVAAPLAQQSDSLLREIRLAAKLKVPRAFFAEQRRRVSERRRQQQQQQQQQQQMMVTKKEGGDDEEMMQLQRRGAYMKGLLEEEWRRGDGESAADSLSGSEYEKSSGGDDGGNRQEQYRQREQQGERRRRKHLLSDATERNRMMTTSSNSTTAAAFPSSSVATVSAESTSASSSLSHGDGAQLSVSAGALARRNEQARDHHSEKLHDNHVSGGSEGKTDVQEGGKTMSADVVGIQSAGDPSNRDNSNNNLSSRMDGKRSKKRQRHARCASTMMHGQKQLPQFLDDNGTAYNADADSNNGSSAQCFGVSLGTVDELRALRRATEALLSRYGALCNYLPAAVLPLFLREDCLAAPRLFSSSSEHCTLMHIDFTMQWRSFLPRGVDDGDVASTGRSGDGNNNNNNDNNNNDNDTQRLERELQRRLTTTTEAPSDVDASKRLEQLFSVIFPVLLRHGAVVDSVHGDSVTCAFNLMNGPSTSGHNPSSSPDDDHRIGSLRAAFCALYLVALSKRGVLDANFKTTTRVTRGGVPLNGGEEEEGGEGHQLVTLQHPSVALHCGIHSGGRVRYGNVGTSQHRTMFTICGPTVEQAAALARTNRVFHTNVLASDVVAKVVEHFVVSRCVVFARFTSLKHSSQQQQPQHHHHHQLQSDAIAIYELLGAFPVDVPPRVDARSALAQPYAAHLHNNGNTTNNNILITTADDVPDFMRASFVATQKDDDNKNLLSSGSMAAAAGSACSLSSLSSECSSRRLSPVFFEQPHRGGGSSSGGDETGAGNIAATTTTTVAAAVVAAPAVSSSSSRSAPRVAAVDLPRPSLENSIDFSHQMRKTNCIADFHMPSACASTDGTSSASLGASNDSTVNNIINNNATHAAVHGTDNSGSDLNHLRALSIVLPLPRNGTSNLSQLFSGLDDDDVPPIASGGGAQPKALMLRDSASSSDDGSSSGFSLPFVISPRGPRAASLLHDAGGGSSSIGRRSNNSPSTRFLLPMPRSPRDGELDDTARHGDGGESGDENDDNSTAGPAITPRAEAHEEQQRRRQQSNRATGMTSNENNNNDNGTAANSLPAQGATTIGISSFFRCQENRKDKDDDNDEDGDDDGDDDNPLLRYEEELKPWDVAFMTRKQLELTIVSQQDIHFAAMSTQAAMALYNKDVDACLDLLAAIENAPPDTLSPELSKHHSIQWLKNYATKARKLAGKLRPGSHLVVDLH